MRKCLCLVYGCASYCLLLFQEGSCAGLFLFVLAIWILAKRQGFPIHSFCLLLFPEDFCAGLCLCLSWFVLVCTCYFNPSEKGLGFWVLWSHVVLWQKVILSDKSNPKTHRQYNPKNNKSNPKSNPKNNKSYPKTTKVILKTQWKSNPKSD